LNSFFRIIVANFGDSGIVFGVFAGITSFCLVFGTAYEAVFGLFQFFGMVIALVVSREDEFVVAILAGES